MPIVAFAGRSLAGRATSWWRWTVFDGSVKIITISASTFEADRKTALEIVSALLGAEYIYEDEVADSAQVDSTAISLFTLPQELLARIADAARVGDFDRAAELIAEAALPSPQAAAKLSRLAEEFDSDNLLRLIEARPQGGDKWNRNPPPYQRQIS